MTSPTPETYATGAVKQDAESLAVAVRTNILDPDGLKDWGIMTIDRGGHYASWEEVQNWQDLEPGMNPNPDGALSPDSPEARLSKLEGDFGVLSWLYAELMHALRLAAATQMAQAMTPQVQQQIIEQIMAGQAA